MDLLNTWQFNLALYYFFVVVYFQFYKLAVKNAKKDGAATIILQTLAGVSILACVPFFTLNFPNSLSVYLLVGSACVFYAINDRLQTTVRKHLEVSTFSVLSQLGTVFLLIYGFTVFSEPIVASKIAGAALILGANIWLFYKPKVKREVVSDFKYFLLGAIALLAFATAVTIDINASKHFNLPIYIAITLLIPALMVSASEKIRMSTVKEEWSISPKRYYVIAAVAWSLTILFSLRSFQLGEVSTIAPLQTIAIILNVMTAFIFQGERKDLTKKLIAAILVMIGVYLTVL
ncbi:MAG TPA: hypothetical protein P5247_01870 [Candidatus Saccharimonadales bacterium]|nr:hypothetical protein [Candidatus Saccharimonadales bacterium]